MSSLQRMRVLVRDADFRAGFRDEALLMPGMLAWGLVSGVALVKGGLSTAWALATSLFVYSAGAQLTGLTMLVSGAPAWAIIAAAVCVNLRFVIFSAGLRPYLIQLSFWRRVALGYVTTDLSPGDLHVAARWLGDLERDGPECTKPARAGPRAQLSPARARVQRQGLRQLA